MSPKHKQKFIYPITEAEHLLHAIITIIVGVLCMVVYWVVQKGG